MGLVRETKSPERGAQDKELDMESIALVIAAVLGFGAAIVPVAIGFHHQHKAEPVPAPVQ
jgi:hypothetical protein